MREVLSKNDGGAPFQATTSVVQVPLEVSAKQRRTRCEIYGEQLGLIRSGDTTPKLIDVVDATLPNLGQISMFFQRW